MFSKATAALAAALCAATLGAGPVAASGKERVVGPYWNPHTKSYFALIDTTETGLRWSQAAKLATTRHYKGAQGRLAVIPDRKTHDFIMEKFGRAFNDDAWIGLRYFCAFRKLMWVNGEELSHNPVGVWHVQWFRDHSTTCSTTGGMQYMPVYYRHMGVGATWQASGEIKRFYDYLIEYPTGKQ